MDLCQQDESEAENSCWGTREELAPPPPPVPFASGPSIPVTANTNEVAVPHKGLFDGLFDDDSTLGRIEHRLADGFMGERNDAANPAAAAPEEQLKARYQAQAYQRLGLNEDQFSHMDPIQRNQRINAAYARMYKSNPEVMKWAGMAAMASDKAGTGMLQTYLMDSAEQIHGSDTAERVVGAPTGADSRAWLAKGNGAIFNDMYWQHLAFQQGGVAEMKKALKEGSITAEQLAGWQQLAAGQDALAAAKESGDESALEKAQGQIWGGNGTLLHAEQDFVQGQVYSESDRSREAFQFLSSWKNPFGVTSPVPGGTTFGKHREGKPGQADVGDFDQRWGWIEEHMLPEYEAFETQQPQAMNDKMDGFIANERMHPWVEKVLMPAATYGQR